MKQLVLSPRSPDDGSPVAWTFFFLTILVLRCAIAQTPDGSVDEPPTRAAPANQRQTGLRVPTGMTPSLGHNQVLEIRTAKGDSTAVLYADFGPKKLVVLPTGELEMLESSRVRDTDQPLGRPSKNDMRDALHAAGFGDFQVELAKPYVFVYSCSDAFFLQTRSILTSMYPGVVRQLMDWGLQLRPPTFPLVVVIMPSRQAFDDYQRMPREVVAYYSQLSNHIILYEDLELSDAAPEYALKEAAYTIAHEGVHQLLANTGVQARLSQWPMWISEGLPEFFCPLRVNSRLVRQNGSEMPERTLKWSKAGDVNDLRMRSLLKMKSDGKLVASAVNTEDLDADGYAVAWGLVHYLANKEADAFKAYLADVSQSKPFEKEPRALFKKHFGDDYTGLENQVAEYLKSKRMQERYVDPIANQTHYVVKSVIKRGRSFQIQVVKTTSPDAARRWRDAMEAQEKTAKFFSFICRNEREADYQVAKVKQLGR